MADYELVKWETTTEPGPDDVAKLLRRLTFNVLIGNGDMHLKHTSGSGEK